jgi:hypothetical protein
MMDRSTKFAIAFAASGATVLLGYLFSRKLKSTSVGSFGDAKDDDLKAQRDPDWAVSSHPECYSRGKNIARVIDQATDFLIKRAQDKKADIFVHGRDAEVLAQVLRRKGFNAAYGLTPRKLTTEAGRRDPAYIRYLHRVCPRRAIHVDTGFEGSVANWLRDVLKFDVEEVWLVEAAIRKERQIPTECDAHDVARNIEQAGHRLQPLRSKWSMKNLEYSEGATCFWAMVYGITDKIGLPRKLPKPSKPFKGFGE